MTQPPSPLSKEDIVKKHFDSYMLSLDAFPVGETVLKNIINRSMTEWAKQESIEFAKWVDKNAFIIIDYAGIEMWFSDKRENDIVRTDEELYEFYLTEHKSLKG